jgi:hypothetical protein
MSLGGKRGRGPAWSIGRAVALGKGAVAGPMGRVLEAGGRSAVSVGAGATSELVLLAAHAKSPMIAKVAKVARVALASWGCTLTF